MARVVAGAAKGSEDGQAPPPRGLALAFGLTWVAYGSYYLCRKGFGVTKVAIVQDLALSEASLVAIDTALLAAYALGQFISGKLGDSLGARRLVAFGMLASAAFCLLFGLSSTAALFIVLFGLNGLAQSTGWPGTIKAMAEWTSPKTRGRVMGLWATCYQFGGIAATAVATWLMAHYGWRAAFRAPAVWVGAVGIAVLLLLRRGPGGAAARPGRRPPLGVGRPSDHGC
jgi:OPA family glycerol-3-phosphate transporter-like MFS transporter